MPCIASVIREAGHEVVCIDCMAMKMGWKSLERYLEENKFDVFCISEAHALYIDESFKLARLIKQVQPESILIAGGGHFANLAKECITSTSAIDFIGVGEGELTIVDLLNTIQTKGDFSKVRGIVYIENGKVKQTLPRELVKDLDTLPLPAYDLMPMDKYGTSKFLFAPGGITLEHSRGCPVVCDFCTWWTQFADRKLDDDGEEVLSGRWRTKSVKKMVDEIELLVTKYNRKCFMFVDGTWNVHPKWSREFAEEIIKRKIEIYYFAFMRADLILRDEKLGVLELLVKSGLSHICIGMEHVDQTILDGWNKTFHQTDKAVEVINLFAEKYPSVFVQGTFIIGSENESRESLQRLQSYVKKLKLDFPAFHILTPVPGTKVYNDALKENKLEIKDFSKYDWNTPIMSTKHLSREELSWEAYKLYRNSVSPTWLWRGLFSRSVYKRNMYIWWLIVTINVAVSNFRNIFFKPKAAFGLVYPEWYHK